MRHSGVLCCGKENPSVFGPDGFTLNSWHSGLYTVRGLLLHGSIIQLTYATTFNGNAALFDMCWIC